MADKIEVKVSHRFKASAERVYDAWLTPDKVHVWLKNARHANAMARRLHDRIAGLPGVGTASRPHGASSAGTGSPGRR